MKRIFTTITVLTILLLSWTSAQVRNVWMRTDMDGAGFTYWVGGTSTMMGMDWGHSMLYWTGGNNAEFEIGPVIPLAGGKLIVVPEIGIEVNMTTGQTNYIMPEIFAFYDSGKNHAQLWNFYYHGVGKSTKDTPFYYGRYFYKRDLSESFAAGVQAELAYDLSEDGAGIASLPVGLKADWVYGKGNTLGCFVGVDTESENNNVVTRVTFVRNF